MAAKSEQPLKTTPQKTTRTTVDTIQFDRKMIAGWDLPPFQRGEKINARVREVSEGVKADGGVLPGILTLGRIAGDSRTYLLDGQHRRAAFMLTDLDIGYADVRTHYFDNMADMGDEFVRLNSSLVRMRPDDILRGLQGNLPALASIKERCKFVGYDMIRRSDKSPIVSMSFTLRMWRGSAHDIPSPGTSGMSAAALAQNLTQEDADQLVAFLAIAYAAWGRDQEYQRLWSGLNLILCAWLYRRTVIGQHSAKTPKLTPDLFKKCLMSVSANSPYLDYLVGRHVGERDRSPAYNRLKIIFADRIMEETKKKAYMPAPEWASNNVRSSAA